MIMKKLAIGLALFATSASISTTAFADADAREKDNNSGFNQYDTSGWPDYDVAYRAYKKRLEKFPVSKFISGISVYKDDPGVQDCLKWSQRVPINYPKRPASLEEALYALGVGGVTMKEYDSNPDKRYSESTYNDISKLIAYGNRAMGFCNELGPIPERFEEDRNNK